MNAHHRNWKTLAVASIGPFLAFLAAIIASSAFASPHNPSQGLVVGLGIFVILLSAWAVVCWLFFRQPHPQVVIWKALIGAVSVAFALVAGANLFWPQLCRWIVESLNQRFALGLPYPVDESLLPYFYGVCGVFALISFLVARRPPPPVSPASDAPPVSSTAVDAARMYCKALLRDLDEDDRQANWENKDYVPLEAQVKADGTHYLQDRVEANLVEAVRSDRRADVFVVIGDPGSGKTVSLKRLVRELCGERKQTESMPVYANLRTFPAEAVITTDSLLKFVERTVTAQTGGAGGEFLAHFKEHRTSKRVFLVLDSFDELPQILDAKEGSQTLEDACMAFNKLFSTEFPGCRCLLASREFRAPRSVAGSRFNIRELTEKQIADLLDYRLAGTGRNTDEIIHRVFRDRPELTGYLRNPFYAALIAEYLLANKNALPPNLFELFNSFVSARLKETAKKLAEYVTPVTAGELDEAARLLAAQLYSGGSGTNPGLELTQAEALTALNARWPSRGERLIEELKGSRLVRFGGMTSKNLAFSHRRFAEFFAVAEMQSRGKTPPLSHIATDSRWRDGLVMFCGITDDGTRAGIAGYCWEGVKSQATELSDGQVEQATQAIHCLRFLTEAFRAYPMAVDAFRIPLGEVVKKLVSSQHPLAAKMGAEAIPLLADTDQQVALTEAVTNKYDWVRETAVTACRNFQVLDDATRQKIRTYHQEMPFERKLAEWRQLFFSLSLSEAFAPLRRAIRYDLIEGGLRLVVLVAAVVYVATGDLAAAFLLGGIPLFALTIYYFLWVRPSGGVRGVGQQPPSVHFLRVVTGVFGFTLALVAIFHLLGQLPTHDSSQSIPPQSENARRVSETFRNNLGQPILDILAPIKQWWVTREIRQETLALVVWLVLGIALGTLGVLDWETAWDGLRKAARWSWVTPRRVITALPTIPQMLPTRKRASEGLVDFRGWISDGIYDIYNMSKEHRRFFAWLAGVIVAIIVVYVVWPPVLGWLLIIICVLVLVIFLVLIPGSFLMFGIGAFVDWRRDRRVLARGPLQQNDLPELLFETLRELQTTIARRTCLQRLLAQRIQLPSPALPVVPEDIGKIFEADPTTHQEWAKLTEFWLGLSR